MRKLLYILLLVLPTAVFGQVKDIYLSLPVPQAGSEFNNRGSHTANAVFDFTLQIPHYTSFSLRGSKDSVGKIMFNTTIHRAGIYNGTTWDTIATGASTGIFKLKADSINNSGYFTNWKAKSYVKYSDTASMLSHYVNKSRTITINGTTQDLSANRTWTVTANTTNPLTFSFGFTGQPFSFNGSVAQTVKVDTTKITTLSQLKIYSAQKSATDIYLDSYTDTYTGIDATTHHNEGSAIVKAYNSITDTTKQYVIHFNPNKTYYPTGFTSDAYCWQKPNISFVGERPRYAPDGKTLISGSVVLGTFAFFANNMNFSGFGVDAGFTYCANYGFSSGADAFIPCFNIGGTQTTERTNIVVDNVITLCKPNVMWHGISMEFANRATINNVITLYGFHGLVIKSENVFVNNTFNYGHDGEGIIIKADTYAPCGNVVINGAVIDTLPKGVAYIETVMRRVGIMVDPASAGIYNVKINNATVSNQLHGIECGGTYTVDGLQIDNYTSNDNTFAIYNQLTLANNVQIGKVIVTGTISAAYGYTQYAGSFPTTILSIDLKNVTKGISVSTGNVYVQNYVQSNGTGAFEATSTGHIYTGVVNLTSVTFRNTGTRNDEPLPQFTAIGAGILKNNSTGIPSIAGTSDINALYGYTPANGANYVAKAGDTMTGTLTLSRANTSGGSQTILSTAGTNDWYYGTGIVGSGSSSDFGIYSFGTTSNVFNITKASGFVGVGYAAAPTSGIIFGVSGNSYFNGTGTFTGNLSANLPAYSSGTALGVVYNSDNNRFETGSGGGTTTNALTFGYGITGNPFTFNGSVARTAKIDTTKIATRYALDSAALANTIYLKTGFFGGLGTSGSPVVIDTVHIQSKLIAGTNITLTGNTISASGGSVTAGRGITIASSVVRQDTTAVMRYLNGFRIDKHLGVNMYGSYLVDIKHDSTSSRLINFRKSTDNTSLYYMNKNEGSGVLGFGDDADGQYYQWSGGAMNITAGLQSAHMLDAYGFASSITPIVAHGKAGQSVDLTQWQDDSGTVLAAISSIGAGTFNRGANFNTYGIGFNSTGSPTGPIIWTNTGSGFFTSLIAANPTSNASVTIANNSGTLALVSDIATSSHTIFTPTTGGTVTLVNNKYNIINPAGTLATLTVALPSSPANNNIVYIKYTQAVTSVTYSGGTVVGSTGAAVVGGLVVLTYDAVTTSWY